MRCLRSELSPRLLACALLALSLGLPDSVRAQCFDNVLWFPDTGATVGRQSNCSALTRCYPPEIGSPSYSQAPGCDPTAGNCTIIEVPITFPGNKQNDPLVSAAGFFYSFATFLVRDSAGAGVGGCGVAGAVINHDQGVARWAGSGSCADSFSLEARACPCFGPFCPLCEETATQTIPGNLFCPPPPEETCCERCQECPGGADVGGGGASSCQAPGRTGDARLSYLAGGPGNANRPAGAEWATTLGRNWSHDYAERLVEEGGFVWMITRLGTFRRFWDLQGSEYQQVSPSTEYRKLSKTASGWELLDLDGTVQTFDLDGRWQGTVDASGNATTPTYDGAGVLTSVSFPDGRSETLAYHPGGPQDGKLAAITHFGIDGTAQRSWSYTWSGDDLTRIDRPDGTADENLYNDPRFPGYLTRIDEVATDSSRRVKKAWAYDGAANVVQTWRGDTVPGPNGDLLPEKVPADSQEPIGSWFFFFIWPWRGKRRWSSRGPPDLVWGGLRGLGAVV